MISTYIAYLASAITTGLGILFVLAAFSKVAAKKNLQIECVFFGLFILLLAWGIAKAGGI